MRIIGRATRRSALRLVGGAAAATLVAIGPALPAAAGTAGSKADLVAAVHYLTTATDANGVAHGTSLVHDGYYESFAGFADFGLTLDGAFALAAAGTDNATLQTVVDFIDQAHKDPSGQSVNDWTGIGTTFASGGSIGKEALLAEATGLDPRAFGGHDLIAALDHLVCTTTAVATGCAGPGDYAYATSTVSQALGIIAQLRAGDATGAAAAITYLESLQNAQGAWPSLLPSSGDSDVDSTAMAAIALALLPHDATATAATTKAEAWIASRQLAGGDFAGTSGSTNSAALAIQALTLAGTTYSAQIDASSAFLAGEQNGDGGFNVGAGGQPGSDVRASAQDVGGVIGTSFGTLADDLASPPGTTTTTEPAPTTTASVSPTTLAVATASTTSIPISVSTVAASATASAGSGPASTTLPVTGDDTNPSTVLIVVLLGVGAAAAGVRRHRR